MSSQLLDVPHKHPSSIWSFADNSLTFLRETVLTAGYGPLTTLAEKAVTSYVPFLSHHLPILSTYSLTPGFCEILPLAVYASLRANVFMNSGRKLAKM
jgi:hypothetical protein